MVRSSAYRTFYSLPPHLRRALVRLGVGTYSVGAVVLARDNTAAAPGRILLLRQPAMSGWSLPAGLLRRGEPPVYGAAREFTEETGVGASPDSLIPAIPNAVVHTRGRWIDMVFLAEIDGNARLRVDREEILDAGWFALDDLPTLTPATTRLLGNYGIGSAANSAAHPSTLSFFAGRNPLPGDTGDPEVLP